MSWLRIAVLLLVLALQAPLLALALQAPALAQTGDAATAPPPPPSVEQLIRLLAEPEVQSWLSRQVPDAGSAGTGAADGEASSAEPESSESFAAEVESLVTTAPRIGIGAGVARWHAHRDALIAAFPELPGGIARGFQRLHSDAREGGLLIVIGLVVFFVAAGYAAEWAFGRLTRQMRKRVLTADEATITERLQKLGLRFALVLGTVIAFAAASLGVFVMINLPALVREVAGLFLFAAILSRLIHYICQLVLAPGAPARRVVPVDDEKAAFWTSRLRAFTSIFLFGWASVMSLAAMGVPTPQPTLIGYTFGLGLLAVAINAIWQRPGRPAGSSASAIAWTAYAVLVYVLWFTFAKPAMWFAIVAAVLPLAIKIVSSAVDNLLRPVGQELQSSGPPSVLAAAIERGARAVLIIAAAWFLTWAWDIDAAAFFSDEADTSPLAVALLNIAIIVIVVDFAWHVARTAIDRYIAEAVLDETVPPEEARRRARIRTLLPIGRNILQVVLLLAAILMILSSLGVQIAPLIAGAGVVGVAIGFGAQTLVKDIVAGMFYLLDDAFRVGEYVIAGSYKGTVESFSLRSIKLRHHRGPLFTVPFGELGAIQNASRDWVIVKMTFTVTHDTDLVKLKKVIKQVSAQLMEDPEIAAGIIEPLKSQGADDITETGIVVRLKFMAIPGKQFTARRVANALIKKAFAENGIHFAFPTVRVAGDGDGDASAAAKLAIDAKAQADTKAAE
jgi:small-conductance mechanosensitive channel